MKLGRILGFQITVDLSWFIIFILLSVSLSAGGFPSFQGAEPIKPGLALASLGALLLFASVLAHELCHSVVGRRLGMEIEGITLFIFGGVARLKDEPSRPSAEFWMTIAGPAMSVVLAFAFYAASLVARTAGAGERIAAMLTYVSVANAILFVFNMVPAFPLDGGRILRSALWAWRKDVLWATRWAANVSRVLAFALIGFGAMGFIRGIGFGLWQIFIGLFILSAATGVYRQTQLRTRLAAISVKSLMPAEKTVLPARMPLNVAWEQYFASGSDPAAYAVEDGGEVRGVVSRDDVARVPERQMPWTSVWEVCHPLSDETAIEEGANAWQALTRMVSGDTPLLFVRRDGRIRGVLTRERLMGLLDHHHPTM